MESNDLSSLRGAWTRLTANDTIAKRNSCCLMSIIINVYINKDIYIAIIKYINKDMHVCVCVCSKSASREEPIIKE